ncbi:MAG: M23 family metallopeptidase [Deltaproteobacteria bacterium]|nr:M23 family metallopeptidase [Deltaproteobacteria bacterium]
MNVYLIFFKGLPGSQQSSLINEEPATSFATRKQNQNSDCSSKFASQLGEINGISGIRDSGSIVSEPGPHNSSLRFDLEEAQAIAGLRSLDQWCQRISGSIENGDTFVTALSRQGLERSQVFSIIASLRNIMDFRRCRAGERFDMLRSPTGRIERFTYYKSPIVSYRVKRSSKKLVGRQVKENAEVQLASIAIRIKGSVYASLERSGESPALVFELVDIFAWDIDFYIDTHPGDTIKLLVEKIMANDTFVRYGRILAAEYSGDIGDHRAFLYQTANQRIGFYDEHGESLRKAFLKSPLKFSRISSVFGMRVHPILGFSKRHLGVDLAAPRGTPIWAPGDGTVTFAGRKGISGKLVVIRHANGYETIFAHLHSIAKGVRKGARVDQKQVIGTVGSTGRSTGPHLHYGMKKNGNHVNPFGQKFPPADPVPKAQLSGYKNTIAPLLKRLKEISVPPDPTTASITVGRKDAG